MSMRSIGLRALLAMAAFGLVAGVAAAQESSEPIKVRVKKVIKDCEGEGCVEQPIRTRKIFIGEDGTTHELSGDNVHWVGADDKHANVFVHQIAGKGGVLGVELTELSNDLRVHFGVPETAGVIVSRVVEDSAAFRAGVRVGDILTAVDGASVASGAGLAKSIRTHEPGESVNLEVWRDGKVQTLSATLEKAESHPRNAQAIEIDCDGGDCQDTHVMRLHHGAALDCGAETCEIEVQCTDDGACTCTVNGESRSCEGLHGNQ